MLFLCPHLLVCSLFALSLQIHQPVRFVAGGKAAWQMFVHGAILNMNQLVIHASRFGVRHVFSKPLTTDYRDFGFLHAFLLSAVEASHG